VYFRMCVNGCPFGETVCPPSPSKGDSPSPFSFLAFSLKRCRVLRIGGRVCFSSFWAERSFFLLSHVNAVAAGPIGEGAPSLFLPSWFRSASWRTASQTFYRSFFFLGDLFSCSWFGDAKNLATFRAKAFSSSTEGVRGAL